MYEVFESLLNQRGLTAYRVSKDTGITQTSLSNWKNGKSNLSQDSYRKLADYFGVSIEYLMTGREPSAPYYLNSDAMKVAQFLYENPAYKSLFDTTMKVKEEDIDFIKEMIERTHK